MTWDTFLTLRGTKGIYLDYVGTLRPSKSYGWGGVVAHKILVTSPEAKFLFSFLGLFGALGFGLGLGLGLVNSISNIFYTQGASSCQKDSRKIKNRQHIWPDPRNTRAIQLMLTWKSHL